MVKPKTIKVLAMVNTLGLYPGDSAEIDHLPVVDELLGMGYLVKLQPVRAKRKRS
jgi:hypothetical protein